MRKFLFVLSVCLLVVSLDSHAQLLDFGIKGGVNFPSLNTTDGSPDWEGKTGWHGGFMARVNIPIVKVQVEALYSQTSFDVPEKDAFKNTHLAVPVTGQISFLKLFTFHTGPQFTYATSQKLGVDDFKKQIEDKTISWVAGFGVMLGSLDVHTRFIFPSSTDIKVDGSVEEFKSNNWQLSLGYWF